MDQAPFRSLDDLIGIRSIGGVRSVQVEDTGGRRVEVTILLIDDQVIALHASSSMSPFGEVSVSRMVDDLWPFSVDRVREIAFDMIDHPSHAPIVCNLLWRPTPTQVVRRLEGGRRSGRNQVESISMGRSNDRVLCAIDESRDLLVLEIEATPRAGASRGIQPVASNMNILPNATAQITIRPQGGPFRPERILISGTPANWYVDDIRIGSRSQLSHAGSLPGELFSVNSIDTFLSLETVQPGMDLILVVTYVGGNPQGEPFSAVVLGVMGDNSSVLVRWTPEGRLVPWRIT